MSKILNTNINPLRNLRNDEQPLITKDMIAKPTLGQDISNFFSTTQNVPYHRLNEDDDWSHKILQDRDLEAKMWPSTSAQSKELDQKAKENSMRNPALAAPLAEKTAQKGVGSQASNQATGKAIKSFTDLGNSLVSGFTEKWNTHQRGGFQEKYFSERQGSQGFGMHTGLHADMRYVARNQTQAEREHIQKMGMGLGGPIGGLAAYFIAKKHTSGMEKSLDLKTATDTTGNKIDPQAHRGENPYKKQEESPKERSLEDTPNAKTLNDDQPSTKELSDAVTTETTV